MDVEKEMFELGRRVGKVEGRLEDLKENLKDAIQSGDEHTRFGVETTRESLVRLDEKLTTISSSLLGPEGQRLIWSEMDEIKTDVHDIKDDFNTFVDDFSEHLRSHASSEGEERGRKSVIDQIKGGWVQPVITTTLVGVLLIAIRFVLGVGA